MARGLCAAPVRDLRLERALSDVSRARRAERSNDAISAVEGRNRRVLDVILEHQFGWIRLEIRLLQHPGERVETEKVLQHGEWNHQGDEALTIGLDVGHHLSLIVGVESFF